MKTSLISSRSRSRAGFTLIELLVVVAIIATLAGLTITGIASAQKKAKASDTAARIKLLDDCLTRYKNDNGEYPSPANPGTSGTIFGQSWTTGGAACLYQALTGDGNDQIKGYKTRGDETAGSSIGEFGSSKGEIYFKDANVTKSSWFTNISGVWIIIDAFRLPFQYLAKAPGVEASALHNETSYDLWSYGTLKAPSDASDLESQRQWITNWK